jgi:hypothetical protein
MDGWMDGWMVDLGRQLLITSITKFSTVACPTRQAWSCDVLPCSHAELNIDIES